MKSVTSTDRCQQLEALLREGALNARYVMSLSAYEDWLIRVRAALAEPAPNPELFKGAMLGAVLNEDGSVTPKRPAETQAVEPSDAVKLAQEIVCSAYGTADMKMLAREVLRKAYPAVTPQEWRELGRLEGVAECAKVALAYTRAPGPDWTKMAPEWETKPEMYKIGYAYASGCSEQADDIYERIIALKDVSEYVHRPSWVPVEQAMPKDGKPVIAFVVRGDGWTRKLRAYYAHQYTIPAGEEAISTDCCEYVEADDEYYLPAGWYESNEYEETNWHVSDPVTHWMELPDGPSSQDGQPK